MVSNKRFFPRKATIRNHIVHSRRRLCYSLIDQKCLEHKIEEQKKESYSTNIFFRPKGIGDSTDVNSVIENDLDSDKGRGSSSFLFVYQTDCQKRLFALYGNELILLDATYRITRYALPLFFSVVKNNINYKVVAVFVTESELEDCIKQTLTKVNSWNQDFSPRYGMTRYCVEEISAMKDIFPGK